MDERHGFLNCFKPAGPTAHDVVARIRRIVGANAGHGGTLDPAAEGVLPVAVGHARRLLGYLRHDKEYEAVIEFGKESDTGDLEGHVTAAGGGEADADSIRRAGASLVGELDLPVPAFSAVHVAGRRLHELARAGEEVEPPVRTMTVFSLDVLDVTPPRVRCRLSCAGGTYVRSLAVEWGRRLGGGAVLARLVRTRAGAFRLADAVRPDDLETLVRAGRLEEVLVSAATALAHLPAADLDDADARALAQGRSVPAPDGCAAPPGSPVRLRRADGALVGIGALDAGGRLAAVRMMPTGTSLA